VASFSVDSCRHCGGLAANWRRGSEPRFCCRRGSAGVRDREYHDDHARGVLLLWRALRSPQHVHVRDGSALAFVTGLVPCPLTTFIMTYALVRGVLVLGLVVTAAMAAGMVVTIGGFAMATILARERCVLPARTESWRSGLGKALEIIGAIAVLVLGALPLIHQFVF
jgi:ABC-type nickel/cobalt efflux system permease component RcnA